MVLKNLVDFYHRKHKQLIYIPILIFLISLLFLGFSFLTTGEFVQKGVSLSGGIIASAEVAADVDLVSAQLHGQFSNAEFAIQKLMSGGEQRGIIIETDVQDRVAFETAIASILNIDVSELTIEQTDAGFGAQFFSSLIRGVLTAFVLMGIVVYLTFRTWPPAATVILAVFADLVVTLAVVSMMGIKLSSGGVAAFLMLIGYAVDTNILLSWRLMRQLDEPIDQRIAKSARTGLLMTLTTIGALFVGVMLTNSAVIEQILTILLVGLFADLVNTWLLNASILRRFAE